MVMAYYDCRCHRFTFSYSEYPDDHEATKSDGCALCRNSLFRYIPANSQKFPDSIEGKQIIPTSLPRNDDVATSHEIIPMGLLFCRQSLINSLFQIKWWSRIALSRTWDITTKRAIIVDRMRSKRKLVSSKRTRKAECFGRTLFAPVASCVSRDKD